MPSRLTAALLLAMTLTTGCGYFQFPGIHRVEVQQGNILTQEMVDQLQPGMTKAQVRYIMGTPLVADSFHTNRWDYYYSIKKANGKVSKEKISLHFADGRLTTIKGDMAPSASAQQKTESPDQKATDQEASNQQDTAN